MPNTVCYSRLTAVLQPTESYMFEPSVVVFVVVVVAAVATVVLVVVVKLYNCRQETAQKRWLLWFKYDQVFQASPSALCAKLASQCPSATGRRWGHQVWSVGVSSNAKSLRRSKAL